MKRRCGSFVLGIALLLSATMAATSLRAEGHPRSQHLEQPAQTEIGTTQGKSTPDVTKTVALAPVTVRGKALFVVRGVLSFSANARATAISDRINSLSEDIHFDPAKLSVADAEGTTDIMAGDIVLMSVTDQDAATASKPRAELATEYMERIRSAVVALRKAYSTKSLLLGGLYALGATLGLVLLLRLLSFGFPKVYGRLELWRGTVIPSLRIQKFELLPSDRITDFALGLTRLVRLVLTLLLLYFYISLVLGFFPWTQDYARQLLGYLETPLRALGRAVLDYLPNLFYIAVILLASRYVIKLTRVLFIEIGKKTITLSGFHPDWAMPTYKIARFFLLAITGIVVFPYLPGAKSPAFQGISIFLGVLLSFGSTSAVANIVAGVILTYMRAFKVGDRVKIADTTGDVIEASLLVTRMLSIKNVEITIANSMVLSSHIINYSASASQAGLILHTTVTIGYDAPWRKVHELLLAAAAATENIVTEPKPFVFQTALDDFYVHYEINAYTDKPSRMAATYSDLHRNIQDKFNDAGMEIMSSHFSTIREGNRMAIPDDALPKGYVAPSFRVHVQEAFYDGVKDGGSPGHGGAEKS
jgi:small-conductance mechanosensitive channel